MAFKSLVHIQITVDY